jgi:LytS/YehU family sensor histidine kinase
MALVVCNAGAITVSSKRENGSLLITVADNGAGDTTANKNGSGIGLANTAARLNNSMAKITGLIFTIVTVAG